MERSESVIFETTSPDYTTFSGERILYQAPFINETRLEYQGFPKIEGKVLDIRITSHRFIFQVLVEHFAVRNDMILDLTVQSSMMRSHKLLLRLANGRSDTLVFKFNDREIRDTVHQTLSRILARKPWVEYGGYRKVESIGGITRVSAQVRDQNKQAESSTDIGLADIEALKRNCEELRETIDKLRDSTNDSDTSVYSSLIEQFGLATDSNITLSSLLEKIVASTPVGVIFAHDLFCLINRKLKMETIFSPSEFMDTLKSLSSHSSLIGVVQVGNYSLVLSREKFNTKRIREHIKSSRDNIIRVEDFARTLGLTDTLLVQAVLVQIEMESGDICRDDGGEFGDLVFYRNTYFS